MVRAYLAPVVEGLVTDAVALASGWVEQHHVGDMDRRFALDDSAGLVELRIRLGVALDQVDVLHDDTIVGNTHHLTFLAFVFAGNHDHVITLANSVHGVDSRYFVTTLQAQAIRSSRIVRCTTRA